MIHRTSTVALETIGCKLNQAETESLARQLAEAGFHLVPASGGADIYILNTCTVTHIADRKCRSWLRQAHSRNPGALIVAVGCYAGRAPDELSRVEGVGLVLNNGQKGQLLELLRETGPTTKPGVNVALALRTRSFIKIQDGCRRFCSYCIVPLVRGREKSRPAGEIIGEIGQRVAEGYKEAVLTGTEVGAYSCSDVNLVSLLERILSETGIERVRLSSLQPYEINGRLINLWRSGRLCRHFHIPLQSGSDAVLCRMNRGYSAGEYRQALSLIRSLVPDVAITTDIIVGFPGETEAEFEETRNLCRELGFARIHVFPYSPRPGTAAARMQPQVPPDVKRQRNERMLALARESAQSFRQRFTGTLLTVLWEKRSGGVWSGLTDNYIRVYMENNADLTNRITSARLGQPFEDGVRGHPD